MPGTSIKTKRNLSKILPFGCIWLITSWVFLFTEQAMIVDLDAVYNQDSNIILTPKIVISWKIKNSQTYNFAIQCFFEMQKSLAKKQDWYVKEYGIYPTFKAGIHSGEVTTGEIGALKKEIFFTGDVLNTTSRIQSLCSAYNCNLLVSKNIINSIEDNSEFEFSKIDESVLKGKVQPVDIYKLTKVE